MTSFPVSVLAWAAVATDGRIFSFSWQRILPTFLPIALINYNTMIEDAKTCLGRSNNGAPRSLYFLKSFLFGYSGTKHVKSRWNTDNVCAEFLACENLWNWKKLQKVPFPWNEIIFKLDIGWQDASFARTQIWVQTRSKTLTNLGANKVHNSDSTGFFGQSSSFSTAATYILHRTKTRQSGTVTDWQSVDFSY